MEDAASLVRNESDQFVNDAGATSECGRMSTPTVLNRDGLPDGASSGSAVGEDRAALSEETRVPAGDSAVCGGARRLAIAKLRLENFKSYGGIVDVGPFHKSFSAVVGPNGSGKSNVIDAMLFVFGRRAKQLRHAKVRELLHQSAAHPNVTSATVTVHFHEIVDTGPGDMDFDVVEGSLFSVGRRAFKDNTSKYYLNEKEVKMTTVVELLKRKGVDLDNNRFLILQGEVEQIAMMKPKALNAHEDGLLEYLEDIIGSNKYLDSIAEIAKTVDDLNEERVHKLNRVKAAERARDSLEESKNEAEEYVEKKLSLLDKQRKVASHELTSKVGEVSEKEMLVSRAKKELDASRTSLFDAQSLMDVLEKDFSAKTKEADSIAGQYNSAKEKYALAEKADIELAVDLKALKSKESKLQSAITRESKKAVQADESALHFNQDFAVADESISALESELLAATDDLGKVHMEVRESTLPLRNVLERKQEELMPLRDHVHSCQGHVDVAISARKLCIEELEAPKVSLDDAEKAVSTIRNDLENAVQKQTTTSKRQNALLSESKEVAASLNITMAESSKVAASASDLRRKLEETKMKSEASASSNRLFSALYTASRQGRLNGIVGRLGDLGSIREDYGVAAGAAAGNTLDNMVVRNTEDAQACIEYMRERNLGRSTFIILEKLVYLKNRMSAQGFDGPRLFDYVVCEERGVLPAFYYALRDTLVAPTLEDARRMAFKPTRLNRVVTLSGELIESSGAMTGGGKGPPRYRMSSKLREVSPVSVPDPAAAGQLERLLAEALERSQALSSELAQLRERSSQISRLLEEVDFELKKLSNNVSSLETQLVEYDFKTLPELRRAVEHTESVLGNRSHPEMKHLDRLETSVSDKTECLQAAKEACVGLESSISKLQEEIVAVGGSRLQAAKSCVDAAQRELGVARSTSSRSRVRAESARKTSLVANKAVEKIKQDMAFVLEERQRILARQASLEDEAAALLDDANVLESQHNSAKSAVRDITDEYSKAKQDLKLCRQSELPLVEALKDVSRDLSACTVEANKSRAYIQVLTKQIRELEEAGSPVGFPMDVSDGLSSEEVSPMEGLDVRSDTNECLDTLESIENLKLEIAKLKDEVASMNPSLAAIAEYQSKSTEYKSQVEELDGVSQRRDSARKESDRLRKARLDEFMQGFGKITMKLKELYQMITLGGDAELELVDSLDPFSEGIVFSVRPPRKSWKNISNLSGGEKTLSSLALVFALHHFKPTPLYFLDEIDAALDFKNVSIVGNYLKERTKNAQFIIISLRNNMFELADRLVGIYKTSNTTKSVTVNPRAFVVPLQDARQLHT